MPNNNIVSSREKEVLQLISFELTTKEIASKLFISPHTAESHRKNLMQKLHVKNTAGMVRAGFERGLLSFSKQYAILLLFTFFNSINLFSVHTSWTGGAGNQNWFNAANWDNGVPMSSDSATIVTDSVIMNAITTIENLQLLDGARLVVSPTGSLSFNNSVNAFQVVNSTVYNHGSIDIQSPGGEGLALMGTSIFNNFSNASLIIFDADSTSLLIGVQSMFRNQDEANVLTQNCHQPIENNGLIDNRGNITSEVSTNESIINFGTIENRGLLLIDSSTTKGIVVEAEGLVDNFDSIIVRRTIKRGIENSGVFRNRSNSDLEVSKVKAEDGVLISNVGRLSNSGKMEIRDVDRKGIECNGTLVNKDTLLISEVGDYGLDIRDSLIVDVGGYIEITKDDGSLGIFVVNAYVVNHGSIVILGGLICNTGVESNGKWDNHGSLLIRDVVNRGIQIDSLINHPTGQIDIINSLDYGIVGQSFPLLFLDNHGKITIDSTGKDGIFILEGEMINNDTLIIKNGSQSGLALEISEFENTTNGYCQITDHEGSGIFIINSDPSIFTNLGTIEIDQTEGNGIKHDQGYFTNSGLIEISNTEMSSIFVEDSLINDVGGIINISNIAALADGIENLGLVINDGLINIDGGRTNGIKNQSEFVNNDSILIANTVFGLLNELKFENYGFLDIRDLSFGIKHLGIDTFYNDGHIVIDDIVNIGIDNDGILRNEDTIEIKEVFSSLINGDSLYNQSTGVIYIENFFSSAVFSIINSDFIFNRGKFEVRVLNAGGRKNHSLMDQPCVDLRSNSFWENSPGSETIVTQTRELQNFPFNIEVGGELIMNGKMTVTVSLDE